MANMKPYKLNKPSLKDSQLRLRTNSLFYELKVDGYDPIFTLYRDHKEYHGKWYYSLHRLFVDYGDISEYNFAMYLLGDWMHWQRLLGNAKIKTVIDDAKIELEAKLRSDMIMGAIDLAKTKGAGQLNAIKYVAEHGWETKRGRPTKAEIERERKINARVRADIEEDAKRLGIH